MLPNRQIVLDTETTGIDPKQGHRIIEIGCVEMINRRLTGNTFHVYINPDRVIDQEAIDVHGITNEFLVGKPKFRDVAREFFEYIKGAELVIHNAPFDVGFMDHEFNLLQPNWGNVAKHCAILDTLVMAKKKHPGQRNSLDALCRRYGIDNSHRELHGALLDAEILADVYLLMSGGQKKLDLMADTNANNTAGKEQSSFRRLASNRKPLKVVSATADELTEHEQRLDLVKKKGGTCLWRDE